MDPEPNLLGVIISGLLTIHEIIKANPDINPLNLTDLEVIGTLRINPGADLSIPPTAVIPLGPTIPELEGWAEIQGPQTPDGFVELVSDEWNNKLRRSGMILVSCNCGDPGTANLSNSRSSRPSQYRDTLDPDGSPHQTG